MTGVARISFDRGALLMSVRDAYDRELVFQEAESYARRHGQVHLEVQRHKMTIGYPPPDTDQACDHCAQRGRMMATFGRNHLCVRCARERVC